MIQEPDFNMDSLRRHRVSKTECLEVLADPLKFRADQEESKRGTSAACMLVKLLQEGLWRSG